MGNNHKHSWCILFSLLHIITRVKTVEENGNNLLLEKGHHTPAKKETTIGEKDNQTRSKMHSSITLTHYKASHDRGRKRYQSVT